MTVLKKTIIALVGTSVVIGSAGMVVAKDRGGRDGGPPRFEKIDANSDGKVDFAEFVAPMNERFDEIDADGNGTVTEAEVEAYADGKRKSRRAKRIAQRFDVDGNNEVTKAELENRQKKIFALMDRNDDGVVMEDELPKRGKHRGGKNKGEKRG